MIYRNAKIQFLVLMLTLMACGSEKEEKISPEFESIQQDFFQKLAKEGGFQFEAEIENRTYKGTDGELMPELDFLSFGYNCRDFEQKDGHITFTCKPTFLKYMGEDVRYDSERPISAPPSGLTPFHEREVQFWFFPGKNSFRYRFFPKVNDQEVNHRFLEETFQKIQLAYFLKIKDITQAFRYEMMTFFPHDAHYRQTKKGVKQSFDFYQGSILSKAYEETINYFETYDASFEVEASRGYFNFIRHQDHPLKSAYNSIRSIEGRFSYQNVGDPSDFLEGDLNNLEKVKVVFRPLETSEK